MINATTSSKAKKNGAPATIQKKVQEVVAVHCLIWVYTLPSMKLDDLHKKMSSAYHGDEKAGIISFSEQCLSGTGVFSSLWDLEEDGSGVSTLSMKVSLSRRQNARYISGMSVTFDTIQQTNQKNKIVIEGRSIYNLGCNTLRSCKKMIALWKQFLNSDGDLPSGTNEDDLDQHILDGMYSASKAGDLDNDEVEVDDDAAAVTVTTVAATTVTGTVALATAPMDYLPCGFCIYIKPWVPVQKGNINPIFLS